MKINNQPLGVTMKGFVLAAAIVAMSTAPSFAGSHSQANSSSNSGASSGSYAGVSVTNNSATKLRTVGTAVAPGLIAGGLSCAGSASVAGGFMGGAFALGTTLMDKDCNTRENAKMLGVLGDRAMTMEILCDSPQIRAADARLGGGRCSQNRRTVRSVNAAGNARTYKNVSGRTIKQTPYP